jgi:hypothetical protein
MAVLRGDEYRLQGEHPRIARCQLTGVTTLWEWVTVPFLWCVTLQLLQWIVGEEQYRVPSRATNRSPLIER